MSRRPQDPPRKRLNRTASGQRGSHGKNRRFQRLIQGASLILFLWLLLTAATPGGIPPDLFLRLDPLVAVAVPLAARHWFFTLLPGLAIILLAVVCGRIFCGYLCPMGATLDLVRAVTVRAKRTATALPPALRHVKYLILAGVAGAAVVGLNLSFWVAPIPLVTRLYTLIVHPLLLLAGNTGLDLGRPVFNTLDVPALSYLSLEPRRFATAYFVAGFFLLLFLLERIRPRFWCRYLCPAGALLALCSFRPPLLRRQLSGCVSCGLCRSSCPAGILDEEGNALSHGECLVCRTCADVCPQGAIRFGPSAPSEQEKTALSPDSPLPSRRAFLTAAGAGIGLAALEFSSLHSLALPRPRGLIRDEANIRPPGAVPEADFLDRCLRCGMCMRVCPTNALQPAWLLSGASGMFSPVLTPRVGPCEPECAACGAVCPSEALLPLPLAEKQQAKIGTAVVQPDLCLAWAEGHSCVVCQEVCPYGAIALEQKNGAKVPAPVVKSRQCFGCGYCERHCPVFIPAITVQPLNALRLNQPGYREKAQAAGLDIKTVAERQSIAPPPDALPEGSLPPGFSE